MLARYVAEIEEVLRNKGVSPPVAAEPAPISRRDWVLVTAIVGGMFVVAELWGTGVLLGLFAKLFM